MKVIFKISCFLTNAAVHLTDLVQGAEQSREEMRSQGQTVVKHSFSPQLSLTVLRDKQSIQEVTHESPPHNSHVATLKLRGPPIFPWKVYKRYTGKRFNTEKIDNLTELQFNLFTYNDLRGREKDFLLPTHQQRGF